MIFAASVARKIETIECLAALITRVWWEEGSALPRQVSWKG